jgi:hypothetical protein
MRFSSFNATTTVASSSSSGNNQVLQYLCSKCNTVLKEIVESKEEEIQSAIAYFSKKEECPKCGLRLANSLLKRKYQLIQDPNNTINKQQLSLLPHPKFQTAYDILEINNRLTLDIQQINPSLLYFTTGESVCIVGQAGFTNLLISRLCVRALLSSNRYDDGGFDSSHVIIIDAGGNNSDPYQCVSFARQYGLDIKKVLRSIIVSRAFTIYQLANLIVNELPKIIQQQFENTKLIVIAGLLGMFMNDPQIEIEEAEFMIDEIMTSIRRQSSQNSLLFIVSLNKYSSDDDNNNNTHKHANYNKRIVKRFSKCIQMSRDNQFNNDDNLIIELSESSDRDHHHRSRSHHHHHHHHHNSNNRFLIKEDDLRKIISS